MLLTNKINNLTVMYPRTLECGSRPAIPRRRSRASGSTTPRYIASPTRPAPRPAKARPPTSRRITYWSPDGSLIALLESMSLGFHRPSA